MTTEFQQWAREIFKIKRHDFSRIVREIVLDDLMADLEHYVDMLIFGEIDSIHLCRKGGKTAFDYYFSDKGGVEIFNYITLNDRWNNRDLVRMYLADSMIDLENIKE